MMGRGKESADARWQQKLFERARRQLLRSLPKAIKAVAKGSGWRASRGLLLRDCNGWSFIVSATATISEAKTHAFLHVRPIALDPLFQKIILFNGDGREPLSLGVTKTFTCRPPLFRKQEISEESSTPESLAANILGWAEAQFQDLKCGLSIDGFIEFLRQSPQAALEPLITALVLQGRLEEAKHVCRSAGPSLLDGGDLFRREDGLRRFVDLAVVWIESGQRARTLH